MPTSHTLLIFGGSLEFSLAIARQAAKQQWAVARACNDSHQERIWLDTLRDIGCERMFIKSQLTEESHFRQALARVQRRWGHVDTVINFADQPCLGLFETSKDDDWHWAIKENLLTVTHGCKAAISIMKRQGHGRLINIATQTALLPTPGQAVTAAIHGAVASLTETLHAELSGLGISVHLACVDYFDGLVPTEPRAMTPLDQARFNRQQNNELSHDQIARKIFKELEGNRLAGNIIQEFDEYRLTSGLMQSLSKNALTGGLIRRVEGRKFLTLTHKEGRNQWQQYRRHYDKWLERMRQKADWIRPGRRSKR